MPIFLLQVAESSENASPNKQGTTGRNKKFHIEWVHCAPKTIECSINRFLLYSTRNLGIVWFVLPELFQPRAGTLRCLVRLEGFLLATCTKNVQQLPTKRDCTNYKNNISMNNADPSVWRT
jgi:hypothetical protein